MRKIFIIIISALVTILIANLIFFRSLYNKEIEYIVKLLDRQVQIVGLSVDSTNNNFASDLGQIFFSQDLAQFFSNPEIREQSSDRMKLFFSKYDDLVTGIKLYDNNRNEFTLKKDETGNTWLDPIFVLHVQGEIVTRDTVVNTGRYYEYYLPVINNKVPVGNIVVTLDYQKYFNEIFAAFKFHDFQWQWILNDQGEIIYDNDQKNITFSGLQKIREGISRGACENLTHKAEINGESSVILSSYYSTHLLQENFGIVFSSPTDDFQNYIIRNSLMLGLGNMLVILFLILFFWKYLKSQKTEIERLESSEKTLFKIIEEMPVGVVIYNREREIIKANRKAAEQYSYQGENEMTGKIFPEPSSTDVNNYYSKNLGGTFSPDQFLILRKEIGEIILFRSSIPVKFNGEDATMDMLIDVTNLESARKQEAKASSAKSEFLARMSYEIRTPLNGIIGMADILEKQKLPAESREILGLLRRSAEVLINIINDVLDFSRIETGRMIIDEIPFGLREEIMYCIDLVRKNVDETAVTISCHLDDNIPEMIIGDPFRLRQVINSFLGHSVENTRYGKIILKGSLKEKSDGVLRLAFEISDTGKSFDKANLKKLFGDYVNIESKVHMEDDESGFGRILARQLVELMGGEFSVESPSGLNGDQGTKIRFSVTAWSNEKQEKKTRFDRILTFGNIKTLVIAGNQGRDEEVLASLHKLGLTMTVTTFQKSTISQIKAIQNHADGGYHLIIILDDKEFDGFEAAKEIHENKLSDLLIIVMISSNDQRGNLRKSISVGVDHYIVKPYEIKELYDVLKVSFPQVDNNQVSGQTDKLTKDLRILIVEDNKMNQKVIGAMLKSLGYSFDFADDGFAGLIQAKTRRYDVIFMDLIMPEMDGFESARRMLEYDSSLLIVAFTADNLPDSKRKAEMSGIREFIPKPVRIEDLKKFFSKFFFNN